MSATPAQRAPSAATIRHYRLDDAFCNTYAFLSADERCCRAARMACRATSIKKLSALPFTSIFEMPSRRLVDFGHFAYRRRQERAFCLT